jgi:outer membrane murein-binding lipoprotein Lpp
MKRMATGLVAGALGVFLLAPCVRAQSLYETQNDREAIENGRAHLQHDRNELRNDVRHGDYAAAAHEQAEMNRRRAAIAERKEDLHNDLAARNYRDEYNGYRYGHHHWLHHRYDDDIDE